MSQYDPTRACLSNVKQLDRLSNVKIRPQLETLFVKCQDPTPIGPQLETRPQLDYLKWEWLRIASRTARIDSIIKSG